MQRKPRAPHGNAGAREHLISLIEPANLASAAVAKRLGAVPHATVTVSGADTVVWEHPR